MLAVAFLAFALLVASPAAEAQPMRKVVAFLCATSCSDLPNTIDDADLAFLAGLEQAGYAVGQDTSLDMSGVGVGYEGLPSAAKKLVERKVNVIVAVGNEATRAARRATTSTPIVMAWATDAVEEGLVASLGRPGGNVTGVSVPLAPLVAKQVRLLQEIDPRLERVAVLWNPAIELHQQRFARLEPAARSLGVQLSALGVATLRDLEKSFSSMGHGRPGGLVVLMTGTLRREIVLFALQHRLVTAAPDRYFVEGGGLLAYGPYVPDVYQRAAVYAAKLLKGARPSELPVEQPTGFALIISKITAKAVGVTIPPSVLALADEVIE